MHLHNGADPKVSITGVSVFPKVDGKGTISADRITVSTGTEDAIGIPTVIKITGNTAERRSETVATVFETTGRDGIFRT
ncbi:MAG: hypothetical protein ABI878_06070 [Acidobacteriota bacterium]